MIVKKYFSFSIPIGLIGPTMLVWILKWLEWMLLRGSVCIVLLHWPSRKHGSSSHVRYTEILGIFPVAKQFSLTCQMLKRKMTGLVDDTFWPLVAMPKKKKQRF